MSEHLHLREKAEGLAGPLPPLLADARHLAATIILGEHGRRRAGMGDEFWQYRQAHPGDSARAIDWRRSARADGTHFVREKEWQAAQTVELWVDASRSMNFSSSDKHPTKAEISRLLGLAAAVLLINAGERVGLSGGQLPPRSGEVQLSRIASTLATMSDDAEYGAPNARAMTPRSRALFVSDFLGDISEVRSALTKAADRGVHGAILQVLDPSEEAFPFDGRTRFLSMSGSIEYETQKAGSLRDRYLDRLAERKAELTELAKVTGWQYHCHHTDSPPMSALLWLYQSLEGLR